MPFVLPAIAAIGTAVAAGIGAAASAVAAVGVAAGLSGAAAATVAEAAVAVGEFGALYAFSALTSPKPKINTAGSPQTYKADPQAPIPFIMARYGVGGNLIYQTTSGGASKAEHGAAGNEYLTDFIVLSGMGPIAIESTRLDDTILVFGGQTCTGGYIESEYVQTYNPGYKLNDNGTYANNNYVDHYWQVAQTGDPFAHGQMPYPSKIAAAGDNLPEWDGAHRLSGFSAVACTRSYDTTVWSGGVGQPQWTAAAGYPVYDPRQDSSYAGGSGPQRWPGSPADRRDYYQAARGTWAPSANPNLHALNYALGFFLPDPSIGTNAASDIGVGRRYAGVGAGLAGVDIDAFVHAANVADANGWKLTGQWTSADGKRSVLAAMLQAGGAKLTSDRGRISCVVSEPLTAVNAGSPLTWADLAGPPQVDTTVGVRDRFNTAFYKYSSEVHRWQVVQADTPVKAATYVAEDGGVVRSTTLELEYVPAVNQAAQLAAYAIVDGREIPNIVLPGKPHLRGYGPGDCLMVDLPEIGLSVTKLVVLKRSTDPATALVTLTCRTETDAKHAYALGLSGVAPSTPSISGFDPSIVPAPLPTSWAAGTTTLTDDVSGETVHVIRIDGSTIDNVYAADIVVSYRRVTADAQGNDTYGPWTDETYKASATTIDLNLPAGRWEVQLRYVTIHGAENVENTLDLGIFTVDGTIAAVAKTITPDLLQSILDQAAAANGLTDEAIADALAKFGDDGEDLNAEAIARLTTQVLDLRSRFAGIFGGLPPGPYVKEIATTTATSAETLGVMGVVSPDGLTFAFNDTAVSFADGVALSTYRQGVSAQIGANSAGIATEQSARVAGDSANATSITGVSAQVGQVAANLVTEQTARATADTAEAQQRTALAATVTGNTSTINANYITLAQADSTEATARLALNSQFQSFQSSASSQLVTLSNSTSSLSAQIASLNSSFGSFQASANSQLATLSSNDASYATSISSLTATTGSLSASVSVNAGAIANLQGRTGAYWYVTATGPSGQAIVSLAADGYGTSVQFYAGRIWFGGATYYDDFSRTLQTRYNGQAKVSGAGFGSSGQFIEWWGPDVALSSMTESNALMYMRVDGSAFFAGGVKAGSVGQYGQYQGSSLPAGVGLGDGGAPGTILSKRGGTVKIDVSVGMHLHTQTSGNPGSYSSFAPSLTGSIQRAPNGGSFSDLVTGLTFGGSAIYTRDDERGLNIWDGNLGGSATVADTPADGDYSYRFLITAYSFTGGGGGAAPTVVNLSIYATNNRG